MVWWLKFIYINSKKIEEYLKLKNKIANKKNNLKLYDNSLLLIKTRPDFFNYQN